MSERKAQSGRPWVPRSGRDRRRHDRRGGRGVSGLTREEGGRRLRSAVQRSLAWRVLGAAGLISLLLAAITWLRLQKRAGDAGRQQLLENLVDVIAVVLATAVVMYPIVMDLVRRLTRASSDLLQANLETLQILGDAVAKRDQETQAHSCRVTIYAVRLAEADGLSAAAIRRLIKGAFLHDVGKVAISDSILLKPGKLTAEEFEVMKTHVDHGDDIVRRCAWLEDARDVVRSHHERYDGNGYLHGLAGEDIPLAARIFAIADVFDALTSPRPYHRARSLDAALEALRDGRGSHFDPRLVDVFARIAPDLHEQIAGRDIQGLRQDLAAIVQDYFTRGLEALEP